MKIKRYGLDFVREKIAHSKRAAGRYLINWAFLIFLAKYHGVANLLATVNELLLWSCVLNVANAH